MVKAILTKILSKKQRKNLFNQTPRKISHYIMNKSNYEENVNTNWLITCHVKQKKKAIL